MLSDLTTQTAEWGLNMMTTGAFTLREAERRAKQVLSWHSTMSGERHGIRTPQCNVQWLSDAVLSWNNA